MRVQSFYVSHPGLKRKSNQDNLYYQGKILPLQHDKERSLFTSKWQTDELLGFGVFDGMGGEEYGEYASFIAAMSAEEVLKDDNEKRKLPSDILYSICQKSNEEIWKKAVEFQAQRIGTTMAFIILKDNTIWCSNIGDSRIYRLRKGVLTQMSMDHVVINPEKPERKPSLSMHLGMSPTERSPIPYVINDIVLEGDCYLLCSDGVTDMVESETIQRFMNKNKVREAATRLLEEGLENGGIDNITIILVKVL